MSSYQRKHGQAKADLETETVIEMTNRNNLKKKKLNQKKAKKKEKRKRRIKFILKSIVFVALIGGAIAFALISPIFNIKEIKAVNNKIVPEETIVSLSGLKTDQNIFRFFNVDIVNKIKENPYIEDAKIHRKLPSKIEIDVKERTPKYSIDYMGKYMYANSQGYFLEISEDSKGLPIIQGISTKEEEVEPGKRLNDEDLMKLEDVIKIINTVNENGLEGKVTSIDISDKNDYIIYLEEQKKRVHLGNNTNLNNKMLYVVAIMEKEQNKEGDIYVNGDLNNKFQPYFREKV